MATIAVANRTSALRDAPPARMAGAFYALTIVLGLGGFMLQKGIVVSSDAAVTTTNILAHPDTFRLSFVANLLGTVCYIAVTALFYVLFKPVNRSVSLVAALISLVGCAMGAVSCGFLLVPPVLLSRPPYASVFPPDQLHALVLLFVKASGLAYSTGMILFGFYCVLIGYLTYRSTFLPRVVGALFALAGLGWLTFLSPPLGSLMSPVTMLTGLIGEGSLGVWLLIKGVDVQRWQDMANDAR